MVFQGAMNSLTPVYTVGREMNETLQRHAPTPRREAQALIDRALGMVGLAPEVARRYPHELSGGMKQRVVIATALFLEPRVVVLDEPTTALDVIVQAQILNTIKELKQRLGLSLVFITHDLATEAEIADRVLVMYAGRAVEIASNDRIFGGGACHPYTRMLLAATPRLHEKVSELAFIPGAPPDLLGPISGCRFRARCPLAFARCAEDPAPRGNCPGARGSLLEMRMIRTASAFGGEPHDALPPPCRGAVVHAVDGVSFEVARGEYPSGSSGNREAAKPRREGSR